MSIEEKEKILKILFTVTDNLVESEKKHTIENLIKLKCIDDLDMNELQKIIKRSRIKSNECSL